MAERLNCHVRVEGKAFANEGVSLDNMRYENCRFKNCQIFYVGGPVEIEFCQFENVRWEFQGAAALTLETMRRLGWTISPPK